MILCSKMSVFHAQKSQVRMKAREFGQCQKLHGEYSQHLVSTVAQYTTTVLSLDANTRQEVYQ